MGTRSLTVIRNDRKKEICVLYRQYDGYLEGHGKDLAEFLNGFTVVNGFNDKTPERAANGNECLAGQIIAHFKEGIGHFYLYPAYQRNCDEEYIYYVDYKQGAEITITACEITYDKFDVQKETTIFKGTPKELLEKTKAVESIGTL